MPFTCRASWRGEASAYRPQSDQQGRCRFLDRLLIGEHAYDMTFQQTTLRRISWQAVVATEVTSERHTGAVLGGFEEISSEDPQAREAAEFATQQLSQQSNSLQPFLLKQVIYKDMSHS